MIDHNLPFGTDVDFRGSTVYHCLKERLGFHDKLLALKNINEKLVPRIFLT